MERGHSSVRAGKRIYRWNCARRGCAETIVLDADGQPVESLEKHEAAFLGWKCKMPGCRERREYQHDRRRRFCHEHGALSLVQRHRMKRAIWVAMSHDISRRGGDLAIVGSGIVKTRGVCVEFATWLKIQVARANLSISEAARRSGTAENTVLNWTRGISMPRDASDFHPLGKVLRITLDDFYRHLVHHYGVGETPTLLDGRLARDEFQLQANRRRSRDAQMHPRSRN